MNVDELVAVLEDAGLSPYQADAYVTLLELGTASATDVADACDVPDPRIYDVLRDLEAKGYVELYKGDTLTARAHDPEPVLEDLRSRSSEYLDAAELIEERWNEPSVADHEVSIVKRSETVFERARELIGEAETHVHFAGDLDRFRSMRTELARARERGACVKVGVCHLGSGDEPPDEAEFDGVVTEARYRPLPSSFVVIVDRTATCFAPNPGSLNEYGVLVSDRSLSFIFNWFFETALWDGWEVLYTERTGEPPTTYVDVRTCVLDLEPLLADGASVTVRVRGRDTETNRPREVSGVVTEVSYSGGPVDGTRSPAPSHLSGWATLTVDAGEERVDVGGWGAVIEAVEAETITVLDVKPD